jgi:hypothetical protein
MPRAMDRRAPASIPRFLKGITFPAHKADLFRHAERRGAEETVLDVIESMPDGNYRSMADVIIGVGTVE